jgi:hypothetical protein
MSVTVDEGTGRLGSTIGGLGVMVGISVGKLLFELQAWRKRITRIAQ